VNAGDGTMAHRIIGIEGNCSLRDLQGMLKRSH
jgi:hypothetical protein